MKKKVFIYLFDGFSDWEISYLTPEINKSDAFDLVYFSQHAEAVISMGGLKVLPNVSLDEVNAKEVDMLILPGGAAWEKDENKAIDALMEQLFTDGKTLAAICAATTYFGKKGFLNTLKHTSNDANYLKAIAPTYEGEQHYINELAVTDANIITANGIAPIEFAREVFKKIGLYSDSEIEKWFQLFKNGVWSE